MQAVLPAVPVNLPAAHRVQVAALEAPLNRPGRHGVGVVEPVEHAEPGGQAVQARLPAPALNCPAGHGTQDHWPLGGRLWSNA